MSNPEIEKDKKEKNTININIEIGKDEHKKLKLACVKQNLTIAELIEDLIKDMER